MPKSCAYRRLANGQPLPNWHPLITGRKASVEEAGIAVPDTLLSEREIDRVVDDAFLESRITRLR